MTPDLFNIIAIIFYVITWVLLTDFVRDSVKNPEKKATPHKAYFITWTIALVAHILSIVNPFTGANTIAFDFFTLGAYVMWFISLILFISTLKRKIHALAVVILPFTVLSILLLFMGHSGEDVMLNTNSGLGMHILSSLLAYSLLMLAAIQSILLALQNNHLHKLHQRSSTQSQSNFFRTLPALEDMEHFLFRLIGIGVLLLSIGLFFGFYYLDDLFGSQVAHKTILSIVSWLIFSALLIGRWKYGWRGKTAVRWTLAGFFILALAFFGSKFIQEFIIKKNSIETYFYQESNPQIVKIGTPHLLGTFQKVFKESQTS